jgi:L-asparaginase II
MGSPLVRVIRVCMALPQRQSGSKKACTGMMQCYAWHKASRKLGFSATLSLWAL